MFVLSDQLVLNVKTDCLEINGHLFLNCFITHDLKYFKLIAKINSFIFNLLYFEKFNSKLCKEKFYNYKTIENHVNEIIESSKSLYLKY